jgi:hypothetical protein
MQEAIDSVHPSALSYGKTSEIPSVCVMNRLITGLVFFFFSFLFFVSGFDIDASKTE